MPKPNQRDYLLKGLPLPIWEEAQKYAASHRPPLSMRWVLIQLLEKWVVTERGKRGEPAPTAAPAETGGTPRRRAEPKAPKEPAPKKPRGRPRKDKAIAGDPPPVQGDPKPATAAPDLGEAF